MSRFTFIVLGIAGALIMFVINSTVTVIVGLAGLRILNHLFGG